MQQTHWRETQTHWREVQHNIEVLFNRLDSFETAGDERKNELQVLLKLKRTSKEHDKYESMASGRGSCAAWH